MAARYPGRITTSFITFWIERAGLSSSTLEAAVGPLLARTAGLARASLLDDEAHAWAVLALEPDRAATLAVAVALSDAVGRDVLRVRLSRSRRLRIEHVLPLDLTSTARRIAEIRWPERDGASARIDPQDWPVGLLAEPALEALSKTLGIPSAWALVPPRGYRGVGLVPREVPAAVDDAPVLEAEGPLATLAALAGAPGGLSALVVLDEAVDPTTWLPAIDGVNVRAVVASPRWGAAGRPHVVAQVELAAPPSSSVALRAWFAGLALRPGAHQGLLHRSAFNPLLQVDQTPWEAVWRLPPMRDRVAGWEAQPRGAGDVVLLPGGWHSERSAPEGSVVDGRLAERGGATWRAWRDWLAPRAPRAQMSGG